MISKSLTLAQRLLVILGIGMSVSWGAHAEALNEARHMIQTMGDQALQNLVSIQRPVQERRAIMKSMLQDFFDLSSIARFTMGSHWRQMGPDQKKKFNTVFEDTLTRIYTQRFEGYTEAQFVVLEAQQEGKGIKVRSEIRIASRPPLKVEWKVFQTSHKGLKVLDVFVDGVSMSITQRSEFSELLQQKGGSIDKFLDALQQRLQD